MEILLLAIILSLLFKDRKPSSRRSKTYKYPKKLNKKDSEWSSEWKWDEESQVWVHPDSAKPSNEQPKHETAHDENIDFSKAYEALQLFTKNEWQNYKVLRDVATIKGYVICPKVRLLDIVKPRNGEKKYKTLLYKIQSKHVDFVVCDQNMNIKAIIELDDSTHDTDKGKERDAFVDTVLKGVGYKVIHTRYINHDILDLV